MKTVITFGTYDLLHIGHVRILQRSAALGDRLVVGVSCSDLNLSKKGRAPVYTTEDRMAIISALECVDEVFVEKSLEAKGEYIQKYGADVLVMGDDWEGRFDEFKSLCEVVYLPRTVGISTSKLIADISDINPDPESHS
ncbi:adenylyltransferase/cytidyltransferase family protein [Kordiimonas aquimaris]|uniref:adenylyltransferase/cytidyltransferase family protein n=1 Tax=Kordiimonas aquimaris TaxID=707591 RepID=UPI0021D2BE15|nr:adenylyltransferase/cytidyltransferase family protein [Kordiimonas aquimaris]